MRVLWLTQWQPPAVRRRIGLPEAPGPQAWVDSLAAALVAHKEVDLTIATPSATAFAAFVADDVRFVGLPLAERTTRVGRIAANWLSRVTPPETLAAASDLVRRARADVVHVHGTESGLGLVAGLVPSQPCVISLQGILQAYERRYFAGRTPAEIARLFVDPEFVKGRSVANRYLQLRREARREGRIMREASCFIGRTDWDRTVLAYVNPAATYYHCDEIMRPVFATVRWDVAPHDTATVFTTSSALLGKGTECLFEALALLRNRSNTSPTLRVAGVAPGSEVDRLYRRAARRCGVAERVVWLGRLDAAAIAGELAAADVFAYPSHVDNSPNSVAEAMLVGTPIVASRVGGIPSLVADGKEGILVPRGDARAFAAEIGRLLDDRALARRLGTAARATALVRHDPERVSERTLEIYHEVTERWRSSSRSRDGHGANECAGNRAKPPGG